MKRFNFSIIVLTILTLAASSSVFAQKKPGFKILNPPAGSVLRAGDQIEVQWVVNLNPAIIENPFGEAELLLETNETGVIRVTPQLSPMTRKFTWTVPAINTTSARLILQAGIEGEGDLGRFFQKGTFSIDASSARAITLAATKGSVEPGEDILLSWIPVNVGDGVNYDVMVSYNRGAHFFKAGTTTDTHFALPVDRDFEGAITVKIVGRGLDGTTVSSLLTRDATVKVRSKQDH
jgi:hypothetical protein